MTEPPPAAARKAGMTRLSLCKLAAMDEERLIELETRFAYQEETLRVLNDIVARQQQQIDQLQQLCRQLIDRVARVGDSLSKSTPADEVPPHY